MATRGGEGGGGANRRSRRNSSGGEGYRWPLPDLPDAVFHPGSIVGGPRAGKHGLRTPKAPPCASARRRRRRERRNEAEQPGIAWRTRSSRPPSPASCRAPRCWRRAEKGGRARWVGFLRRPARGTLSIVVVVVDMSIVVVVVGFRNTAPAIPRSISLYIARYRSIHPRSSSGQGPLGCRGESREA